MATTDASNKVGRELARKIAEAFVRHANAERGMPRLKVWVSSKGDDVRIYFPGELGYLTAYADGEISEEHRGRMTFLKSSLYRSQREALRRVFEGPFQEERRALLSTYRPQIHAAEGVSVAQLIGVLATERDAAMTAEEIAGVIGRSNAAEISAKLDKAAALPGSRVASFEPEGGGPRHYVYVQEGHCPHGTPLTQPCRDCDVGAPLGWHFR